MDGSDLESETQSQVELFSTCPPLNQTSGEEYLSRIIEVARVSERCGFRGILVYADNSQIDPWLVTHIIIQHTRRLCPLVAVQPVYAHPYSVAKMVASLAHLHGRRVYLNMVAGGFKHDLAALNDTTPHDARYERLIEYTQIIIGLLRGDSVSFDGTYYKVDKLKLEPAVPRELMPTVFIAGSSAAGQAAAEALGATAICYPKPLVECRAEPLPQSLACGVRLGILAESDEDSAWAAAHARFPVDRKGELTRQLSSKVSDSVWHQHLTERAGGAQPGPYWLVPFQRYQTNCPYLVGDFRRVGRELVGYMDLGYRTFILDVPADVRDLMHARKAFDHATMEALCSEH